MEKIIHDDEADFKRGFRRSDNQHYVDAFEYATSVIRDEILSLPNMVLLDTRSERTAEIIKNSDCNSLDFTDELLISTAKANRLSVFTDDKDYLKKDISLTVFTA